MVENPHVGQFTRFCWSNFCPVGNLIHGFIHDPLSSSELMKGGWCSSSVGAGSWEKMGMGQDGVWKGRTCHHMFVKFLSHGFHMISSIPKNPSYSLRWFCMENTEPELSCHGISLGPMLPAAAWPWWWFPTSRNGTSKVTGRKDLEGLTNGGLRSCLVYSNYSRINYLLMISRISNSLWIVILVNWIGSLFIVVITMNGVYLESLY